MEINWTSDWRDSLIWCPSQLERDFKYNDKTLTLYCRWRHSDPWTFDIFEMIPTKRFMDVKSYESMTPRNWINLGSGMSENDDIEDVHKYAEKLLMEWMKKH